MIVAMKINNRAFLLPGFDRVGSGLSGEAKLMRQPINARLFGQAVSKVDRTVLLLFGECDLLFFCWDIIFIDEVIRPFYNGSIQCLCYYSR
jgi:hypothetical protein